MARDPPLRHRHRLQPPPRPPWPARAAWSRRRSPGSTSDFALFDASPIILNTAIGGAGPRFRQCRGAGRKRLEPAEPCWPRSRRIERDFGRRRGTALGRRACSTSTSSCGAAAGSARGADHSPSAAWRTRLRASAAGGDRAELADRRRSHRPPSRPRLASRRPRQLTAPRLWALSSVGRATDF